MKGKIYFVYCLYILIISSVVAFGAGTKNEKDFQNLEVYFIDSDMLRLVSVDFECNRKGAQKQAEAVIDELIKGRDYNKKICRMIPPLANCMEVTVRDNTAYVDLLSESFSYFPDGRVCETLIIYQIVNSLTSVDGIDKVKFLVDGKIQKDFKGFIDIRETFIPDYYI